MSLYCEFCDATPCKCTALTLPVVWVESQLSNREILLGVYDMTDAPEAVRAEFERNRIQEHWVLAEGDSIDDRCTRSRC